MKSVNVDGDLIEIGCHRGGNSVLIQHLIDCCCPHKKFHVYDSFVGLVGRTEKDNTGTPRDKRYAEGKYRASIDQLKANFDDHELEHPTIHESNVADLSSNDIPDKISFALIDVDLYQPTIESLELVWPRMSKGGVVLIDDYEMGACPGVSTAAQEFFEHKSIEIVHDNRYPIIAIRTPHFRGGNTSTNKHGIASAIAANGGTG